MPHIIVKIWPGKSKQQKKDLAEDFKIKMNESWGIPKNVITIAFDEVKPEEWYEKVHIPLIDGNKTGDMVIPESYKGYKHES